MKVTIWQCRDWCCEGKPFHARWWNARVIGQPDYESARNRTAAYQLAVLGAS
jgi:hypothetical protein